MKSVCILGSTGSIGCSTLDVIARHPDRYRVFALSAYQQHALLLEQCRQFRPAFAVLHDPSQASSLQQQLEALGLPTRVLSGESGLLQIAAHESVDTVMAAIVGAAGLPPVMAAVESGKQLLLANKEALVMSGALMMDAARASGAQLLPIDSEHNAIFQCLPDEKDGLLQKGVSKILLTASGGPFRTLDASAFSAVTPDQACDHPNWQMGRKISVDSATMMNKGLELIEASWLFDIPIEHIDVVVHPQSVIHSMVQYVDGSVIAQMGNPDMRTPIAHALAWPERIGSGVAGLDFATLGKLDFEAPDEARFPALRLARQAAIAGGTAPAILNAANEIAVEAFLQERIRFDQISRVVEAVLDAQEIAPADQLAQVMEADARARDLALAVVMSFESGVRSADA